jgi:hypothetical protein
MDEKMNTNTGDIFGNTFERTFVALLSVITGTI